jgi:secreted trypsin-like serine protease
VTIVGSRGNFCSGALIAPDLVLSAAHCTTPGATYKVVEGDPQHPRLVDVRRLAAHPRFDAAAILAHRATADIALLQLGEPLRGRVPAPTGVPNRPLAAGNRFDVTGIGVTVRGDGRSAGKTRIAALAATGQPGTLQIRLADPASGGGAGLGACTGDSGAPVSEDQGGRPVVVGVVSWSTGPELSAGCGGLTGVTPLTLYHDWLVQTARSWGRDLQAPQR